MNAAIGAAAQLTDISQTPDLAAEAAALAAAPTTASTRRLARDAIAGFGLNVGNIGASILASIVLARTMDVNQFGLYSWAVALVTLLTVFAVLGVDRLLVRDIAKYSVGASHGLIRGIIRRSTQLVAVVSLVILAVGLLIVVVVFPNADRASLLSVAAALIALPLLALLRVTQSALMGFGRIVVGQFSEILLRPTLFLVLAVGAALLLGPRLDAPIAVGLYALAAAACVAVAIGLLWRATPAAVRNSGISYDTRRWVIAGMSLVVLSGGLVINNQTGVILLGALDAPASAGIYAVAQRGALLVAFPLLALNAAIAPTAARLWAEHRKVDLQRLVTDGTRGVVLASLPIALIFITFGSVLLQVVYGSEFAAGGPALAIVCIGQLFNAATGVVATLLVMTGNQWRATIGLGAGIVTNIGLGVLLIPSMHATGAALAAAASLLVMNVIHVAIARTSLGIDSSILARKPARSTGA